MQRKFVLLPLIAINMLCSSCNSSSLDSDDVSYSLVNNNLQYGCVLSTSSIQVYEHIGKNKRILKETEYMVSSNDFSPWKKGTYNIEITINNTKNGQTSKQFQINVVDRHSLKLLAIGNSFSDDTMDKAYYLAKSLGVTDIELGILYIGGCSIETHYSNAMKDATKYEYRKWNSKDEATPSYVTVNNMSMEFGIRNEKWDFICLQQASVDSGLPSTYEKLPLLMDYVKSVSTNKDMQFIWNMTWAYESTSSHSGFINYDKDQMKMYNCIVETVKDKIIPLDFVKIIPTGTAIQNARTSFYGDTLTRDGFHLTVDLGRYTAGLTLMGVLLGKDVSTISYNGDLFKLQLDVAIESAKNAIKKPFEVTQSKNVWE